MKRDRKFLRIVGFAVSIGFILAGAFIAFYLPYANWHLTLRSLMLIGLGALTFYKTYQDWGLEVDIFCPACGEDLGYEVPDNCPKCGEAFFEEYETETSDELTA